MSRTLKGKNSSRTNGAPEAPYFNQLVELNRQMAVLREDVKQVCIEARQADVRIQPLKRSVKLYLESEEERTARIEKEEEAERILRALGHFADTPLGQAAVDLASAQQFHAAEPFDPLGDPPEAA